MPLSTALLRRLFSRQERRHYALLDDKRHCRMLLTATQRPEGDRWVEVVEARLAWIGRPLPQIALRSDGTHKKAALPGQVARLC